MPSVIRSLSAQQHRGFVLRSTGKSRTYRVHLQRTGWLWFLKPRPKVAAGLTLHSHKTNNHEMRIETGKGGKLQLIVTNTTTNNTNEYNLKKLGYVGKKAWLYAIAATLLRPIRLLPKNIAQKPKEWVRSKKDIGIIRGHGAIWSTYTSIGSKATLYNIIGNNDHQSLENITNARTKPESVTRLSSVPARIRGLTIKIAASVGSTFLLGAGLPAMGIELAEITKFLAKLAHEVGMGQELHTAFNYIKSTLQRLSSSTMEKSAIAGATLAALHSMLKTVNYIYNLMGKRYHIPQIQQDLKKDKETLETNKQNIERTIQTLTTENTRLKTQLADQTTQVTDLTTQVTDLTTQVTDLTQEIKTLKTTKTDNNRGWNWFNWNTASA